jgi:hypothetical protein
MTPEAKKSQVDRSIDIRWDAQAGQAMAFWCHFENERLSHSPLTEK